MAENYIQENLEGSNNNEATHIGLEGKISFFKAFLVQQIFLYIITNKLGPKHSVKFSLQLDNHPLKKKNTGTLMWNTGTILY